MTGLQVATASLLLVAAADRFRPFTATRRCLALALGAAACAALLDGLLPSGITADFPWSVAGRPPSSVVWLTEMLAIGGAGSATFAFGRQVLRSPGLLRLPPTAVTLAVALVQVVLWAATPAGGLPGGASPPAPSLELGMLEIVSISWPVAAAWPLGHRLRDLVPVVRQSPVRVAIHVVVGGMFALAVAAGLRLVAIAPLPDAHRLAELSGPIGDLGLCATAIGTLLPTAARITRPAVAGIRTIHHLRRLHGLARSLAAAAPEWSQPDLRAGATLRRPSLALYRRVILIRDITWALRNRTDDAVLDRAGEFADHHRPHATAVSVAALAEACWLHQTIRLPGRVPPAQADAELRIIEHRSEDLVGEGHSELAFVLDVARVWDRERDLLTDFVAWVEPATPSGLIPRPRAPRADARARSWRAPSRSPRGTTPAHGGPAC